MPDNEKTSYDLLLEEIDKLKKEQEKLRKDLDDMTSFNRALLSRKPNDNSKPQVDGEKFRKYLEEGE